MCTYHQRDNFYTGLLTKRIAVVSGKGKASENCCIKRMIFPLGIKRKKIAGKF